MINYRLILLYSIETFLMLYVGIGLFRLDINKKRILCTMGLYAISVYTVRAAYEFFGIPFGTHTIVLLMLFSGYSIFICKMSVVQAISTGYIGYTLQTIGEWTVTIPIVNKYNLIIDGHFFESWQGILIGLTAYTFLIIMTLVFFIRKNRWLKNWKS